MASIKSVNISVIGTGYVGLSMAILLAQDNNVIAVDTDKRKVDSLNKRLSPILDKDIENYLECKELNLIATTDATKAYTNAEFVIIATPTNYDSNTNTFDTSSVESVATAAVTVNPNATIIIKSTIPVGYTNQLRSKLGSDKILFSPEFLREGKALHDNLYPSRIVVGGDTKEAHDFANLLVQGAIKEDVSVLFTNSTEAEAIKLFANTYLAMRVAYFNELDTYAEVNDLSAGNIIKGISLDPRIGDYYNNPSFGYGGYCLPKDTKQLLANYRDIPNELIRAIVAANATRMKHIAETIIQKQPKVVGIHRLTMKTNSDNFRQSSIQGVINILVNANIDIVIYEPTIAGDAFDGHRVMNNIDEFVSISDVIIANRFSPELESVKDKVYSRDIFSRD